VTIGVWFPSFRPERSLHFSTNCGNALNSYKDTDGLRDPVWMPPLQSLISMSLKAGDGQFVRLARKSHFIALADVPPQAG
jgi:hypothetical protein